MPWKNGKYTSLEFEEVIEETEKYYSKIHMMFENSFRIISNKTLINFNYLLAQCAGLDLVLMKILR